MSTEQGQPQPPVTTQPPGTEPPARGATAPAAPQAEYMIPKTRFDEEVAKRRAAEEALTAAVAGARVARVTAELVRAGHDVDDASVQLVIAQYDLAYPDPAKRPPTAEFVRSEAAPAIVRRAFAQAAAPAPTAASGTVAAPSAAPTPQAAAVTPAAPPAPLPPPPSMNAGAVPAPPPPSAVLPLQDVREAARQKALSQFVRR